MKKIEVAAAIVVYDDKILCVQRGENKFAYISKKFEFPGGKIEPGESITDTITREVMEELHMQIEVQQEYMTVTHQYPDFHLTMHTYLCGCENPAITLTEHIDYKWMEKNDLHTLDWAEADIPIMEKLKGE